MNAGILWDKSFTAMGKKEWDNVIAVHLKGTYKCCKAMWDIFQKQKYGHILMTASGVGICEFIFQILVACVCVCGVEADLVWCKWYNSELGAQTAMLPSLSPKE